MAKSYTAADKVKEFKELDIEALVSKNGNEKISKDEVMGQLAVIANIQWLENIGGNLANIINSSQVKAWQTVFSEYQGDEGRPSDWDLKQFLERGDIIIVVLKAAIQIEDSTSDKIQWYKNLITVSEAVCDCQSWEKEFTSYGSYWKKSQSLTAQAKAEHQASIKSYNAEIRKLEAQLQTEKEKQKRDAEEKRINIIKKYWEEHPNEKAKLDDESRKLEQQISALYDEISNIPGKTEETNIQERIRMLKADKDALSIFKAKEKKAIQEQIDVATAELNTITARINTAVDSIKIKIDPLEKRQFEITSELTKDR